MVRVGGVVYERRVQSPDGTRWIVARRTLFGRPRYRGFRFGVDKKGAHYEAAHRKPPEGEQPHTVRRSRQFTEDTTPRKSRASYRDLDDDPWVTSWGAGRSRRRRRGGFSGPIFIPTGGWGGGSSGGGSGGDSGGGSGGGSRDGGGSGGGDRGGSDGGGRGGAAGAVGGLGALGAVLKWALIVVAIAAAVLFAIFVLIPAIALAVELALLGLIVAWREVTKRPWVVEAREDQAAPEVHAWEVVGLKKSRATIDDVAEDIRRGEPPQPDDAEIVAVEAPD